MTVDTFTNPVYPGYFADPFVLRVGDAWYAYGTGPSGDAARTLATGRAVECLRSDDLVTWTSLGPVLVVPDLRPTPEPPDRWQVWAPEVAMIDGRFHLYYSAGIEDRAHHLRVATADGPDGPFLDAGLDLTPDERFAIDAHPFRDVDGAWYLYYARDVLDGDRVGTSLAVDRLLAPDRLAGEPRTVLLPSADWQLYRRARPMYGTIVDWHTLEGPFVRIHDGRYWCLYSGGNWTGPGYGVGAAVADSPLGPFVEPVPGPVVLRGVPGLRGPGHCSVTTGPDGQDWLVYHAWDDAGEARRMCIDRLRWTADGPRADGPTVTPQPRPAALAPL